MNMKCRWCQGSEFVEVSVTDPVKARWWTHALLCAACKRRKIYIPRARGDGPKPRVIKRPKGMRKP